MLAAVMVTGLVACGKNSSKSADGKLNVVTTIFPEYDWTREIVGQGEFGTDKSAADKVEITMLLDNGVLRILTIDKVVGQVLFFYFLYMLDVIVRQHQLPVAKRLTDMILKLVECQHRIVLQQRNMLSNAGHAFR